MSIGRASVTRCDHEGCRSLAITIQNEIHPDWRTERVDSGDGVVFIFKHYCPAHFSSPDDVNFASELKKLNGWDKGFLIAAAKLLIKVLER